MITGSLTIHAFKEDIEESLSLLGVEYETDFQFDPDLGGYCYTITTCYASCIFSDSTRTGDVEAFVLDNSQMNYAIEEDLTEEQCDKLSCFIPVFDIYDLVEYLSTQKLKPLKNYD